jgi:hypothetical protein
MNFGIHCAKNEEVPAPNDELISGKEEIIKNNKLNEN